MILLLPDWEGAFLIDSFTQKKHNANFYFVFDSKKNYRFIACFYCTKQIMILSFYLYISLIQIPGYPIIFGFFWQKCQVIGLIVKSSDE